VVFVVLKLASSCIRVDWFATRRAAARSTFHADALVAQVGQQSTQPAPVQMSVAEDAAAACAYTPLQQIHPPATAVTVCADP